MSSKTWVSWTIICLSKRLKRLAANINYKFLSAKTLHLSFISRSFLYIVWLKYLECLSIASKDTSFPKLNLSLWCSFNVIKWAMSSESCALLLRTNWYFIFPKIRIKFTYVSHCHVWSRKCVFRCICLMRLYILEYMLACLFLHCRCISLIKNSRVMQALFSKDVSQNSHSLLIHVLFAISLYWIFFFLCV